MSDAQTITLARRGRWYGTYGIAFCPAHENTHSPALTLADGDGGQLLVNCKTGCDGSDVLRALRARGLLHGVARTFTIDPQRMLEQKVRGERERAERIMRARRIWKEAGPIGDTLAERYVRTRGVQATLAPSLRFHGRCWHGETRQPLPALVAAVGLEGEAEPVAVHRTYLEESGRKARVQPNKAMLGPVRGGAVRLSDGAGPLVIAEGIETALSLIDGLLPFAPRVWASLSTSGMASLALPRRPTELVIAPDGDCAGRKAAEALARRAIADGWRVRIMAAPGEGLDWADVAQGTEE